MAEITETDHKRAQASLSGPPLHEGWRAELTEKVAQALAEQREALSTVTPELAEARREAVALVLLCQTNGIWTDRLARVPNLDMARKVMADLPYLAESIYADADQLIAAYEEAQT